LNLSMQLPTRNLATRANSQQSLVTTQTQIHQLTEFRKISIGDEMLGLPK
jgi:hypothetical protein